MDARRSREQQKRRAWKQGIIAAVVILFLLVCVAPLLWIMPVSFSSGDDTGERPSVATPMATDQSSPTT